MEGDIESGKVSSICMVFLQDWGTLGMDLVVAADLINSAMSAWLFTRTSPS